jgi:hypothetical protein
MKRNLLLLTGLTAILLIQGCQTLYVSDIETYYYTKHCATNSILIMSCEESSPSELNKNLCVELDNMFKTKGYSVNEYCPIKFDSVEYAKIITYQNPEFVLCILPQRHNKDCVTGCKNQPYKIEALYRRDSGKISSVFLGKIDISYSTDKKSEIVKDASDKIFNAIVDNNILK